MKLAKGKVIAVLAVVAILAGAFWYGGGAPGLQGWTVEKQPAVTQQMDKPANGSPELPEKGQNVPDDTLEKPEDTEQPGETVPARLLSRPQIRKCRQRNPRPRKV